VSSVESFQNPGDQLLLIGYRESEFLIYAWQCIRVLVESRLGSYAIPHICEELAGCNEVVAVAISFAAQAVQQGQRKNSVAAAPIRSFLGHFIDTRRG
jgi:hypothetical protein